MKVIPAYGRDYKSAKAAREDWNAGKDFIIADVLHPYAGKPINIQDGAGVTHIRYSKMRKICTV